MQRWHRDYERLRLNPDASDESWTSKYDIESMHWTELQQIYLPELGMCWGPACSALRKSRYAYKQLGRTGQYRNDIAYRITKIQNAMGIAKTEFAELGPYTEEWSEEDKQLRREEQDEGDWDFESEMEMGPQKNNDDW